MSIQSTEEDHDEEGGCVCVWGGGGGEEGARGSYIIKETVAKPVSHTKLPELSKKLRSKSYDLP